MDSRRAFFGVSAIVFAASAAMTIASCASMSAMGEMGMPGGWALSMVWTLMRGQTWSGAAAAFVGAWVVMMIAMMLPSLAPMLWRYRQAIGTTRVTHRNWLTAVVSLGYYAVWASVGIIVFPLGTGFAWIAMREPELARAVPIAVGAVVLVAGVVQYTGWKERHLAFCREATGCSHPLPADAGPAWRHGLRIGFHCSHSCAGLTAIGLGLGIMDLRVMAVVTVAITAEHLAPAGVRVARVTGALGVASGLLLIGRAAGLG